MKTKLSDASQWWDYSIMDFVDFVLCSFTNCARAVVWLLQHRTSEIERKKLWWTKKIKHNRATIETASEESLSNQLLAFSIDSLAGNAAH